MIEDVTIREEYQVIETNGNKEWRLNGEFHREDGPAIEWSDGTKSWYLNDQLHREDGPAIEYVSGNKSWWLNGKKYSEQGWRTEIFKRNLKKILE